MHQLSLNTFDSFRYRNYLLLWVASLYFVVGFRLQLIVLGWFTYDQAGSPLLTAMVVSLDTAHSISHAVHEYDVGVGVPMTDLSDFAVFR